MEDWKNISSSKIASLRISSKGRMRNAKKLPINMRGLFDKFKKCTTITVNYKKK